MQEADSSPPEEPERGLVALLARMEAGQFPWEGATARLGPVRYLRTGQPTRGVAALQAWDFGYDDWFPIWQVYGLHRPTDRPTTWLEAHLVGGRRGVWAGPTQANVAPHGVYRYPLGPQAFVDEASQQLEDLTLQLGPWAPDLSEDLQAVLAFAAAWLELANPSSFRIGGHWTPKRLRRVAAWGQWLADRLGHRHTASPGHTLPADPEGESYRSYCRRLLAEPWLAHALPPELREPPRSPSGQLRSDLLIEGVGWSGLWQAKTLRGLPWMPEAPPLELPSDNYFFPGWSSAYRNRLGVDLMAARGLAMAERTREAEVDHPGEPSLAWRWVGAALAAGAQQGLSSSGVFPSANSLEPNLFPVTVLRLWSRLRRRHLQASWIHHRHALRLLDLTAVRWSRDALHWAIAGEFKLKANNPSLARVPVVRLADARLSRRPEPLLMGEDPTDEDRWRRALTALLPTRQGTWADLETWASDQTWTRSARRSKDGSLRWLDVPPAELAQVQRILAKLLQRLRPRLGTMTAFHPGASPALHARAHAGARAAVLVDLRDFFGSIRPHHLDEHLGDQPSASSPLVSWTAEGRSALRSLIFLTKARVGTNEPYLPQGAPTSPAAANLAAAGLDRRLLALAQRAWADGGLTRGAFCYTRYADDLVLSTSKASQGWAPRALALLAEAANGEGFELKASKTRTWSLGEEGDLTICGLRVPTTPSAPLKLGREAARNARSALHQLRLGRIFDPSHYARLAQASGTLAHSYHATGELRWLAFTSRNVRELSDAIAGPLFGWSFRAGWSEPTRLDTEHKL